MTLFSWIYMLAVWSVIIVLNLFCFYKVLQKPRIESPEEQPESDPARE